jgi:hypothetical protein
MTDCRERERALLRLGSERPDDAVTRPGFETRLRARIASGDRSPLAGGTAAADWSAAVVALLRPALGAAAALALIAAALFYQAASGVTSAQTADLTSILSTDPAFSVVLSDGGASPGGGAASQQDETRPAETPP